MEIDAEAERILRYRAKAVLRTRARALRNTIPAAAIAERSTKIRETLEGLTPFARAKRVALFYPIEGRHEVDLRPLDPALRARGALVATLDGDGQNDPAFLPKLIAAIENGGDRIGLAAGQRIGRKDTGFKKMQSRIANGVRNAILPQVTALALALGQILSGAVLVEVIFGYPGIGTLLYQAIRENDHFVIQGIVFTVIVALGFTTFVLDVIYPLLDPRISYRRA